MSSHRRPAYQTSKTQNDFSPLFASSLRSSPSRLAGLALRLVVIGVLAFTVLWLGGHPTATTARAQSAADDPGLQFGDRLDVSLINVEVWVTDKKGQNVTGLLADDFEVFEDGAPVEVTHFAEYDADASLNKFSLGPPAELDAPSESDSAVDTSSADPTVGDPFDSSADIDPGLGEGPSGHLVIYFDEIHSGPVGRKQLIKDLTALFDTNPVPAENVLLLRQTEMLTVEAPFGSSLDDLRHALADLETTTARGRQTWADDLQAIRRLQDLWEAETVANGSGPGADPCTFFAPKAFREVQFYVETASARVRETLANLRDASVFLAGIPGPKTLLYLSDGLILAPGANLMSFVKSMCPGEGVYQRLDVEQGLNAEFRDMTRHAAANRITFYTLQTLGTQSATGLSGADQRGLNNTSQAIGRYDSQSRLLQREGLSLLAAETGGRAIFNQNRFLDPLERVTENMKGYYSLAYVPRHGGDGLEHRIKVKLAEKGFRVRHRPGYRDKSSAQRLVERLQSTLYLGLMANPLDVRLGVGTLEQPQKGRTKKKSARKGFGVPLHVRLPAERLTFLPQKNGDWSRLTAVVLAQDERRRQTAFVQKSYDVPKPEDTAADISMVVPLDLEEGIHILAVAIRDEASLETSFVSTGIQLQPSALPDDK